MKKLIIIIHKSEIIKNSVRFLSRFVFCILLSRYYIVRNENTSYYFELFLDFSYSNKLCILQ